MKHLFLLGLLASALAIVGCFAHGRDINFDDVKRLEVGVSTRADAERIFGLPSTVTTPSDGHTYLGWMYVHTGPYGIGTGSKNLTLMFRPDGKYLGIAHTGASGADVAPAR